MTNPNNATPLDVPALPANAAGPAPVTEESLSDHIANAHQMVQDLRDLVQPVQMVHDSDWRLLDANLAGIATRLERAAAVAAQYVRLVPLGDPYLQKADVAPPGAAIIAAEVFAEDEPTEEKA